jgi:N-glycosylase/DNA lyase
MLIKCTDGILEYPAVLDIHKTLTSGQTFRWFPCADGGYFGTAGYGSGERKICLTQQHGGNVAASVTAGEFKVFWHDYFDLGTDYSRLDSFAEDDTFFAECLRYGRGLHVLRQDLWETVITFILSQNNNMPRIQTCIGSLVKIWGHFPSPEEILASDSLEGIRCGYRLPYLKAAAEFKGFYNLYGKDYAGAKALLKQVKGIGDKVADCIILFGLHNRRAFPVDIWIERVIKCRYSGMLNLSKYGDLAGIVQQYVFYYAINHRREFLP